MLAASPLPPVLAPAGVTSAPLPAPALAQVPAMAHITYFAPPPTLASNTLLNQRQPQVSGNGGNGASVAIAAAVPQAVVSSAGLQPAALRPVTQEFGYSSAFMAQWIDQASGPSLNNALQMPGYRNLLQASGAADMKFMPSNAGVPIEIPPMQQLAQRFVGQRQPVESGPSVIDAMRNTPTRTAMELLSAGTQSIQLNVNQLTQAAAANSAMNAVFATGRAMAPAQPEAVAAQATNAAPAARGAGNTSSLDDRANAATPRILRERQAVVAYTQAVARMGAYTPPEAAAAPDPNAAPIEAIRAII